MLSRSVSFQVNHEIIYSLHRSRNWRPFLEAFSKEKVICALVNAHFEHTAEMRTYFT